MTQLLRSIVLLRLALGAQFVSGATGNGDFAAQECRGRRSPTVVLVAGLRGFAEDWKIAEKPAPTVFAEVGKFTRVCAYDLGYVTDRAQKQAQEQLAKDQPAVVKKGSNVLCAKADAAQETQRGPDMVAMPMLANPGDLPPIINLSIAIRLLRHEPYEIVQPPCESAHAMY